MGSDECNEFPGDNDNEDALIELSGYCGRCLGYGVRNVYSGGKNALSLVIRRGVTPNRESLTHEQTPLYDATDHV